MDDQIGPVVLGAISAVFTGYGLRELWAACFIVSPAEWRNRAMPGAASLIVAGLFADLAYRTLT